MAASNIKRHSKYLIRLFMWGVLTLSFESCSAQTEFPLYTGKIPNSKDVKNEEQRMANKEVDSLTSKVSVPSITVYSPAKGSGNGTAVIICPGGGYHTLLTKREGSDVAKAFNQVGVTAFVLKYRLPSDRTMIDKSVGPLQDAQQAILFVRRNIKRFNIDPEKVGLMGFSAGGHLAATAGTHFEKAVMGNNADISLRPDFMLLINPVISLSNRIGHIGSRKFLLGEAPSEEKIRFFSNELHVSSSCPPTFLVHSGEDKVVGVENSLEFYHALKNNGVSAGLHIYAKGEHGFLTQPSFDEWFGRCIYWMRTASFIN